jgi:hypothetical protein
MSLLVSLSTKVTKKKSFPKLMIDNDGLIILFLSKHKGFVVNPDSSRGLGFYDDTWFMSNFKNYEGEVTLKNE